VLNLYGGWGKTSLKQLLDSIATMLELVKERIVDVACGPGTFGRRLATPSRMVYGIDISMGMLQQGLQFT
jgi:ubiquinone/menaquinone biosynthesis C-methylase UbiE